MSGIAIAIVFQFSDEINQKIHQISAEAQQNLAEKIYVEQAHISLWMGLIDEKNSEKLHNTLRTISQKLPIPSLKSISKPAIQKGKKTVCSLIFQTNDALQDFHESILTSIKDYSMTEKISVSHFSTAPISQETVDYLNNFEPQHCGINYFPHITLGFGTNYPMLPYICEKPTRLCIYELGNHGTCQTLIASILL